MTGAIPMPLLVIAGGRATRLGKLGEESPKYLAPVDRERTFADVHLEWARAQGFDRVVLCVGHLGEMVRAHCGDGRRYGLRIDYSIDGPTPLGTGGAIRAGFPRAESHVAVTYGDTLLDLPCAAVAVAAVENQEYALMTVYENRVPGHVCNATLLGDRALYSKRAPDSGWRHIDYGFFILSRQFIDEMPPDVPLDLADPLTRAAAARRVRGYLVESRFWEIGTPGALAEFQRRFRSSRPHSERET